MADRPALSAESTPPRPLLFDPLRMRGLTLKNRIMISAMAMYSSSGGFTTGLGLDVDHLVSAGVDD